MRRAPLFLALLAGIAWGCANKGADAAESSSAGSTAEPRLFTVNAPVGKEYTSTIKTAMKAVGPEGAAGFEGVIKEKLLGQEGSEQVWELSFEVTSTNESGVMKGAAANFQQMDGMVMKRYADATGNVSKMMLGEISVPSSGTPDLVYSKKPVKVGDTWPSSIDYQGQKIKITYKLAEYGKLDGIDAARIEGRYDEGQMIKNIEPLVFWVDLSDGRPLSSSGAFEATTQGATVRLSFEIKRS
jgi:hypothetical protein